MKGHLNFGKAINHWRFLTFMLLMFTAVVFLAACNKEQKNEPSSSEPIVEESVSTDKAEEEAESPENPPSDNAELVACKGILFEDGDKIEGTRLADCMVEAILNAGTGTQRVNVSTGEQSIVQFQWNPDYSMHVESEQQSVVIQGDKGWMKQPGVGWVEEDDQSSDPDVVLATNIIKLTRVFAHPMMIRDYLAMSPTWIVVGEESVPDDEAFVDVAWHLVPEGPVEMGGVTLTDVGLWITNNYLGAYYVTTGTFGGFTTTTSNTFIQWGKPVDIPKPGK